MTVLVGCGFGAPASSPTRLDLGGFAQPSASSWKMQAIALPPLGAATNLKDEGVIWRQGVEGSPNRYATFRWNAAPSVLVRERLFERLSQHGPVLAEVISADMPQLRVTLMQFEQVYAPDGASNDAVVTIQAILIRDGRVLGQFLETQKQPALQNTAPAGAVALRIATDELIEQLAQWLKTTLR
jgi:cholesterol transport system auxiliary component